MKKIYLASLISISLIACGQEETIDDTNYDQSPSQEAIETLKKDDKIKEVYAVNDDEHLLIAIDVKHRHRFKRHQHDLNWTEEMKAEKPNMKVFVATDYKIVKETKRAAKIAQNKGPNTKQTIQKIIKLSKEET
ncbi:MAG TPA: hypothetical protein VK075_07655 [Pseudogracilibacillus sp.]|nr:hypothetical protein [Pseudogracilibacillus sp.]